MAFNFNQTVDAPWLRHPGAPEKKSSHGNAGQIPQEQFQEKCVTAFRPEL
jgi:hypothetical protein